MHPYMHPYMHTYMHTYVYSTTYNLPPYVAYAYHNHISHNSPQLYYP